MKKFDFRAKKKYAPYMKMDQYYNIESDADKYSDSFDEIIDLVVQAKEAKKIDEQQARLLLNLAVKKQNQREIKSFFGFLVGACPTLGV